MNEDLNEKIIQMALYSLLESFIHETANPDARLLAVSDAVRNLSSVIGEEKAKQAIQHVLKTMPRRPHVLDIFWR